MAEGHERRCEVFTEDRSWRTIDRADLAPGMVFRLFEADGAPVAVKDEETGDRIDRWRVTEDGKAEPLTESTVERAVRAGGFFWPSGSGHGDAGWVPRRLR